MEHFSREFRCWVFSHGINLLIGEMYDICVCDIIGMCMMGGEL